MFLLILLQVCVAGTPLTLEDKVREVSWLVPFHMSTLKWGKNMIPASWVEAEMRMQQSDKNRERLFRAVWTCC